MASVNETTWQRYLKTLTQFLQWTELFQYDNPDDVAALHWCTYLASTKQLLPSTLNQKLSHLQFFSEMGIITPIRTVTIDRFITGLKNVVNHTISVQMLQPSLILKIFNLSETTPIQDAILFQAFTGLRGGQMVKITPSHCYTTPIIWYHHTKSAKLQLCYSLTMFTQRSYTTSNAMPLMTSYLFYNTLLLTTKLNMHPL